MSVTALTIGYLQTYVGMRGTELYYDAVYFNCGAIDYIHISTLTSDRVATK